MFDLIMDYCEGHVLKLVVGYGHNFFRFYVVDRSVFGGGAGCVRGATATERRSGRPLFRARTAVGSTWASAVVGGSARVPTS